jgi:hypothetical protein
VFLWTRHSQYPSSLEKHTHTHTHTYGIKNSEKTPSRAWLLKSVRKYLNTTTASVTQLRDSVFMHPHTSSFSPICTIYCSASQSRTDTSKRTEQRHCRLSSCYLWGTAIL